MMSGTFKFAPKPVPLTRLACTSSAAGMAYLHAPVDTNTVGRCQGYTSHQGQLAVGLLTHIKIPDAWKYSALVSPATPAIVPSGDTVSSAADN